MSHTRPIDLDTAVKNRTRALSVLIEDVYQAHNAASIIRTCDHHGIQDLHVVETRNRFNWPEPPLPADFVDTTEGAWRRVTIHRYQPADTTALTALMNGFKQEGYRIAATSLRPGYVELTECTMDEKLLLCFGTEEHGLSETLHAAADVAVRIPMFGMTQSLNVSVSVALCLHELRRKLEAGPLDWALDAAEQRQLKATWSGEA
ncbi:TrmH family RNA methyltransferase [Acanthopleuribacter pedis]|uniref:RNA methyltransferase n=1 Tax=Acanthopleuribacter pedis TaxID=442870 RepID=A0A8J7U551_9BACT|nr:RNA methyltransferase [Acanthopleuribacter pedis]MBO1322173.1 RNA methyltransferase [Acanthopleuribacter pedis]